MKHAGSHIRKLAQLTVGYGLYRAGRIDYMRVAHKKSAYIGPVLVYIGHYRTRNKRAGDIASAAGEHLNRAVRHCTVKAGYYRTVRLGKAAAHKSIGGVRVEPAFGIEPHYLRRIDKIESEACGEHYTAQIFAAGRYVIVAGSLGKGALNNGVLVFKRQSKPELIYYAVISGFYLVPYGLPVSAAA